MVSIPAPSILLQRNFWLRDLPQTGDLHHAAICLQTSYGPAVFEQFPPEARRMPAGDYVAVMRGYTERAAWRRYLLRRDFACEVWTPYGLSRDVQEEMLAVAQAGLGTPYRAILPRHGVGNGMHCSGYVSQILSPLVKSPKPAGEMSPLDVRKLIEGLFRLAVVWTADDLR